MQTGSDITVALAVGDVVVVQGPPFGGGTQADTSGGHCVSTAGQMASPAFERAVDRVAAATADLLAELPPRRNPPTVVPPLRRRRAAS